MLSNAGLRFTGFEASRRGLSARRALCNNHNWRKLDVCLCPPCVMGMVGCWGRERLFRVFESMYGWKRCRVGVEIGKFWYEKCTWVIERMIICSSDFLVFRRKYLFWLYVDLYENWVGTFVKIDRPYKH